MNDQQEHLQSAIQQQQTLINEIAELNNTINIKKESAIKLQGVIEYLKANIGGTPEESNIQIETP